MAFINPKSYFEDKKMKLALPFEPCEYFDKISQKHDIDQMKPKGIAKYHLPTVEALTRSKILKS